MSFFKKLFGSGDDAQTFEPPSLADLEPFRLRIEDIFSISGRGTVVTGKIECGVIKVGDAVEISGGAGAPIKTKVTGIEMFRKLVDTAGAGDDVGCLLKGVGPQDVQRGQVLSKA